MSEQELVGVEAKDLKFDIEGVHAVISGTVEHVGKVGSVEIALKAKLNATPVINKVVDAIEEVVPGDQKALAEMLKVKIIEVLSKI
jgi:ethanolamine utilization microcompartment shell protein EutS